MPKGRAATIVLGGYLRARLEGERSKLEDVADTHAAFYASLGRRDEKVSQREETHIFTLLRLKAILLAADGWTNKKIADELQISQHTVGKWRRDFAYILSREDLPTERITEFFWYTQKPVQGVLQRFRSP